MALIVEDGSKVPGAESYISVSDATAYHSNRGNVAWAALTTAQMEVALRKATDYLLQAYRGNWKGYRILSTQALDWPRSNVLIEDGPYNNLVAVNVVPQEVKNACAELALKTVTGDLAPDLEQNVTREAVGPLSVDYDRYSPQYTRYRAIDMMLRLYLSETGASTKLERN